MDNTEIWAEIFEFNHDVEFKYNDKIYFLTVFEISRGKPKKCLRAGLNGTVINWIEEKDFSIDGVKVEGKSIREIANKIKIISIY